VPRPGRLVELAVTDLFSGDAGRGQRCVAGRADVSRPVEPLILEELDDGAEDALDVITRCQPYALL
jgi:hypothetical protein